MRGGLLPLLAAGLLAGCANRCEPAPAPEGAAAAAAPARDAGTPPDDPGPSAIVLVVVDTLRADFLPFYGHAPNTAPFLDAMLRDAVVFENAYATSSWTVPSMASLHTGVHPSSHGVVTGGISLGRRGRRVFEQPVLPAELTTIAELVRGAGFTTIAVSANQHLSPELGFGQGFDVFSGETRFEDARRVNRTVVRHLGDTFGETRSYRWLSSKTFLWVHYFDPHEPYTPRIPWARNFAPGYVADPAAYPAYMTMRRIKEAFRPDARYRELATPLYEAEIAFWDDQFDRLAREIGVAADDVLFIFTSDHGEEFSEHGGMGHGGGLHEEVVHVPLAMRWPRGFSGPRRVRAPVSLVDVLPTIAALVGIDAPPGTQGRSLAPLLRGGDGDAERPILMELDPPKPDARALRRGRFKLIRTVDPGAPGGRRAELYDLDADPGELRDLSRRRPDVAARIGAELDAIRGTLPPPPSARVRQIDDEAMLQQLINMDYVQDDRKPGGAAAKPGRCPRRHKRR